MHDDIVGVLPQRRGPLDEPKGLDARMVRPAAGGHRSR